MEPRLLLAATVLSDLPDVSMPSNTHHQLISLSDFFDDPELTGTIVEVKTSLGDFLVETYDTITPVTAQNFIDLTEAGNYTDMFFHRSVPGFVLQGGGFTMAEGSTQPGSVANNGNIANEFDNWFAPNAGGLEPGTPLNTRGTLAMARVSGQPDSANSQWFVNVDDNSEDLDGIDGGFTVFGHVIHDGMNTVDSIIAVDRVNAGGVFNTLPVVDYDSGSITRENLVTTEMAVVPELTFEVTANSQQGIVGASIESSDQLRLTAIQGHSGISTITISATDLQGNSVSSTFDVFVPMSTAILLPDGSGQNQRPEFSWLPDSSATSYELWVNHVGGQNAIIYKPNLTTNGFTPAEDLPIGTYQAWVRPKNDQAKGVWSAMHTFRIGLTDVSITSPSSRFVNTARPVIEWTASETATEYELWVNHVGVQNQIIRETSLTTTSYTPAAELADGVYRVWVKAKNSSGETDWSPGLTFEVTTVAAPEFTAPTTPSETARPTFIWTGSETATFELWVNQTGGAARVIHNETVTGTSFTATEDLANGEYRAWVRLRSAGGDAGQWSAPLNFSVATAPETIQIADVTGTDTARPIFSWPAADRAVRYELWVNDVGNGVPRVIWETTLTELQFAAGKDLASGSYRAWIRAFSAGDIAGEWSNAFDFVLS